MRFTAYIKLMRPKHWIKNILVFAVLFYSGRLFNVNDMLITVFGALSFCLVSSAVYIFNDINDSALDAKHEIKSKRPIASGVVGKREAWVLFGLCVMLAVAGLAVVRKINTDGMVGGVQFLITISVYLLINIAYSSGLKNVPIIDVTILTTGFLLRLLAGSVLIGQPISSWMILTVTSISFYLSFGKRRNEIIKYADDAKNIRRVLKHYTKGFLDKNMYMSLTLTFVFYALWAATGTNLSQFRSSLLIWTMPVVMLIFMKYNLNVEQSDYADPVDVLLSDRWLILLVCLYGALVLGIVYGKTFFNI